MIERSYYSTLAPRFSTLRYPFMQFPEIHVYCHSLTVGRMYALKKLGMMADAPVPQTTKSYIKDENQCHCPPSRKLT